MTGRKFIGIDLAWKPDKNPSGIAVIQEDETGAVFTEVRSLSGLVEVKDFASRHLDTTAVIALDAPLVVKNKDGSRPAEICLSKQYGANHASCYPSNLGLFDGEQPASAQLADWLAVSHGFEHAPAATSAGRVMMEVYPHAAYIALRDRNRIIKYKKGSVRQKCEGLTEVQRELRMIFGNDVPVFTNAVSDAMLNKDPTILRGAARKSFEDELDAMLCAYLGYRYAKMGRTAFDIFGDANEGYIVNPKRTQKTAAVV